MGKETSKEKGGEEKALKEESYHGETEKPTTQRLGGKLSQGALSRRI